MTTAFRLLDRFLDDPEALGARVRAAGPYRLYVQAPIASGLGVGLTRRHDAALAWVMRQVAAGSMEPMDVQAARSNLFRGTWLERGQLRGVDCDDVVSHGGLAAAASELLGASIVEPYMLYANLLLPGQELPVHHDTPEFVGLDKTNTPEWFLVVCGHSGLFADSRIRVASGVVFIEGNGDLVVYPDGIDAPPSGVPPRPNSAIVLDADELVHGVARVGGADAPAPPVEIGMELAWDGGWVLRKGENEVARYPAGDVRLSLQWKAWVFADEADRSSRAALDFDLAVERLVRALRERGRIGEAVPDEVDLALLMMDEFIQLPTS